MGTGGAKAASHALNTVKTAPEPEALPSKGIRTQAFDAMVEPDPEVVEVFESLTPREAASVYLNVALGPVRENSFVQDAQKALAVVKTLLVFFFFFFFFLPFHRLTVYLISGPGELPPVLYT